MSETRGDSDGQSEESVEDRPDGREGHVATPAESDASGIGSRGALGLALATLLIVGAAVVILRPWLVPAVNVTFVVVTATGLVGAFFGGRRIYRAVADGDGGVDLPLVEYRTTVTVPGEDVDDVMLQPDTGTSPLSGFRSRRSITGRLRDLVVAGLERTGDLEDSVEEQLEAGRWTDDAYAASFFSIGSPLGRARRLRLRLRGDNAFAWTARHVVDVAARRLDLGDREWTDPTLPGDVGAVEEGWVGSVADVETRDRRTERWRVVGGLALVVLGVGVVVRSPGLVLSATAGTGLAAYGYAGSPPTPRLDVERRLGTADPDPGDVVRVTVELRNAGESTLYDLRLLDGVPPGLTVSEGTPRHGTVLRPGATAAFSYAVEADRGRHEFDPLTVVARNASGSVERAATVEVAGATALTCRPRPTQELSVPVRSKTTRDVGRVVTDAGGSGLEFHSVREYRSGDPLKRIDWNRVARGGDLATLQFHVERSATVVLLIDTRAAAFVASERGGASAVERSMGAAAEMFVGLLDGDDRAGLAALGPDPCWLAPGTGHGHWTLARDRLAGHEAFSYPGPDASFFPALAVRRLRKQLPSDAQLVFFSPLSDEVATQVARRLHVRGYEMTVVSPAATGTESAGRTVAHLERRLRLTRLREADVRVIDWKNDEPLRSAIDRAGRRWSR